MDWFECARRAVAMNKFDLAVYICLCVAIVAGFSSGLLRSLAAILGYLTAMPVAVIIATYLSSGTTSQFNVAPAHTWAILFLIFLAIGFVLSNLFRLSINEMVGPDIGIADRAAGATLGAVRVALLAVLMVLIFDRIIPPDLQPGFLAGSRLRPLLSVAGQHGVKTLPPEIATYIDRLKQQRGI
jgi:membrane protein required for colicin V production